jgi:hypothetical protein
MKHGMLTTNWAFEIGFSWNPGRISWFWVDIDIRPAGDHKGCFFSVAINKLMFEFNIYDVRHEDEEAWDEYASEYYQEEEYY